MFDALVAANADVDSILTDLHFVKHRKAMVEYEMFRTDPGGTFSHFVLFIIDQDGVWRLKAF